jgi:2-(3-amino-3-carboxypropyl)histidine synthase
MKTIHINCSAKKDLKPLLKKTLKKLAPYDKIGLLTTSQHLHELVNAKKFFEENKKDSILGGQILGCNAKKAEKIQDEVDAFLYIGSGRFHPLAMLAIDKPVIIANPYTLEVSEITKEERSRAEKKQKARIMRAIEAQNYGIIISTKTGQHNMKKALEIKNKIEDANKKAYLFVGEEINPARLMGYKIDAWINTACPRIVEDEFDKPILNPDELETILNSLK